MAEIPVICPSLDPSLPDQLQGWGTVAAVAVSLVLLGREIQTRRQVADQELRSQARRVEVGLPEYTVTLASRGAGIEAFPVVPIEPRVTVRNGSDETITDLAVVMTLEPASALEADQAVTHTHLVPRLPGGDQVVWTAEFVLGIDYELYPETSEPRPHQIGVTVHFTDAAGNRWRRERDHSLRLTQRAGRRRSRE